MSILGISGMIGGLLCAVGDIFFDLKGKGSTKSGPANAIESNWIKMASWRFRVSILLAAMGVPMYLLGFIGMSRQLAMNNTVLGTTFLIFAVIGSCGGFFIHAILCLFPLMRKSLNKNNIEDAVQFDMFKVVYQAVKIPFVLMFCSLVIVTSIILIIAILSGHLHVPIIFVVINPLGLMLIGWLFRFINKDVFSDLPGIIMPSIGIAMIGLMVVISA